MVHQYRVELHVEMQNLILFGRHDAPIFVCCGIDKLYHPLMAVSMRKLTKSLCKLQQNDGFANTLLSFCLVVLDSKFASINFLYATVVAQNTKCVV